MWITMRWDRGHRSPNLEDRRGQGGGSVNILGLAGLLPLAGRFGWKGILLLVGVVVLVQYTGVCSHGDDGPGPGAIQSEERATAPADELVNFVGYVLDDAQASFEDDFEKDGKRYTPARLVVFSDGVASGCGGASAAVGPFYCPNDQRVYIDLSFYRELQRRFGAPGDFAQAYVIAHEIGHHVQHQLGGLSGSGEKGSVETELQADCLAGMWAADAEKRGQLEEGDMKEALDAASAIGDDNIQRQTTGRVQPETWTHGSSAQRQRAFQRGHDGGTLASCGL
jgi:predicted metalloprotease